MHLFYQIITRACRIKYSDCICAIVSFFSFSKKRPVISANFDSIRLLKCGLCTICGTVWSEKWFVINCTIWCIICEKENLKNIFFLINDNSFLCVKYFLLFYIQADFSYINLSDIIQTLNYTILLINYPVVNYKIWTTLLLLTSNFFQEEIHI